MNKNSLSLCLALLLFVSLAVTPVRAASPAVQPSRQHFEVDGKTVSAEIYNIDGSNYFKLRDIAMLLKDTPAHFSVGYDEETGLISVESGKSYVPVGGELAPGADKSATCKPSSQSLMIDGYSADLTAYNLGGNNFFKLRDLGNTLGFYVGYDQETDTAMLDSAYFIRRTDLSDGIENLHMYFEVPVFYGDSAAIQTINDYFEALAENYAANDAPEVRDMVRTDLMNDYGPTEEYPYFNERSAVVRTCGEDLISVTIDYEWYMGGVFDYGMYGYNLNARTGERVYLDDLLSGSEREIKESIITALLEQYPGIEEAGVMDTPMDAIRAMDLHDISFFVEDGTVNVVFSKYEITYGAAGMQIVTLPAALKPLN